MQNPTVEIEVNGFGTITVELDAAAAPISVENFLKLVGENYYDGLTFHRIIRGFMIQGGGGDGSLTPIKGEFSANGVANPLKHDRGAISMARTNVMDSATSQFFICDADSHFLDGNYAAFGRVTAGMEVVDKIAGTRVIDGNGTVPPADQPIIKTIRRI